MFSVSDRSPSSQWRMGALAEKRLIKGRVIPILIENVPLPATLRVRRGVNFTHPEINASIVQVQGGLAVPADCGSHCFL